jgi:hypothetical protein
MWWFGKQRYINYRVVNKNLIIKVAFFQGEIWLTQKQLGQIFGLRLATVNEHLKKIFQNKKFNPDELIRQFVIKASDGKKYQVSHYRSDVMEEIAKRVRS